LELAHICESGPSGFKDGLLLGARQHAKKALPDAGSALPATRAEPSRDRPAWWVSMALLRVDSSHVGNEVDHFVGIAVDWKAKLPFLRTVLATLRRTRLSAIDQALIRI
jgi:hypothetical protein